MNGILQKNFNIAFTTVNNMYKLNRHYKEFISNREAILANLTPEELTLKFLWKNPDEHIIKTVSKEPFFQLYFKNDIMFLLLKFEDLKWIDIPCLFTRNSKSLFHFEEGNFPCKIMLANSNTGKLFVNYKCCMPQGITKAFIQGIHTQKDMTKKAAIEKINSVRSSYSATEMSRLSLGKAR